MLEYDIIKKFNDTDMLLYRYLMNHRELLPYTSIRKLAKELNLSTSSIIRFCEKAGFNGWEELKNYMITEVKEEPVNSTKTDIKEALAFFEMANTPEFIEKLEEGAEIVRNSDKVIFVGVGASGTIGKYGARYLSSFGVVSFSIEDTYYSITNDFGERTTVMIPSISGENENIAKFIHTLREHKCKIMSITNDARSTIARLSDWNISYQINQSKRTEIYDTTTQVPALFIMEAIARRI